MNISEMNLLAHGIFGLMRNLLVKKNILLTNLFAYDEIRLSDFENG